MTKSLCSLFIAGLLLAQTSPGDRILGMWRTPNGESTIEVVKCGDAYCGNIKSMAKAMNDLHNPDASLRNRPLLGVQIMKGFKYAGAETWSEGTLYGPERGKEVSPKIVLTAPDSLDIRVAAGLVKKTVTWTRIRP